MHLWENMKMSPVLKKLAASIRDCKIKGLDLETQIVKGSGHAGTKPEGYNRGTTIFI